MSTVAQLIDRIKREWLVPPSEAETQAYLSAQLTAGAATASYNDDFLSPEEEDLFGPGTIIEIESELMQLSSVDAETDSLTIGKRGVLGTTDATHASGSLITLAPEWPRISIFNAIADAVEQLWPDLYKIVESSSLTFSAGAYTEVPAAVMQPLFVYARPYATSTDWEQMKPQFFDRFPASSTGKAVFVTGLPNGASGYLIYKAKFTRPTAEADELTTTVGLEDEWEQIVMVGAVAYLLAGKDLSAIQQEYLSEQLAAQSFPVMTAGRIRDGLLRYHQYLLDKAKRNLRGRYQTPVVHNSIFG